MSRGEKLKLAAKLKLHRVKGPRIVVEEALRADIRVATALAMLENETGIPQRNIFGCDWGAISGPPYCQVRVTKRRVRKLLAHGRANGVGWTQLTYIPFVHEAQRAGGAHKPRFQCRAGFRVLRENFEREGSLYQAYRAYNGSGPAAEAYAARALGRRSRWLEITNGR